MYTENLVFVLFLSVISWHLFPVSENMGDRVFPIHAVRRFRLDCPAWEGRGLTASAQIPGFLDSWARPRPAEGGETVLSYEQVSPSTIVKT